MFDMNDPNSQAMMAQALRNPQGQPPMGAATPMQGLANPAAATNPAAKHSSSNGMMDLFKQLPIGMLLGSGIGPMGMLASKYMDK